MIEQSHIAISILTTSVKKVILNMKKRDLTIHTFPHLAGSTVVPQTHLPYQTILSSQYVHIFICIIIYANI